MTRKAQAFRAGVSLIELQDFLAHRDHPQLLPGAADVRVHFARRRADFKPPPRFCQTSLSIGAPTRLPHSVHEPS